MSSKYRVFVQQEGWGSVVVEADSEEDAYDAVYEVGESEITWYEYGVRPNRDVPAEEILDDPS